MHSRKTRILEVIHEGSGGLIESHVSDLAAHLRESDYEPIVLVLSENPSRTIHHYDGLRTHVIQSSKAFHFQNYHSIKKILIQEEIDILHAHGSKALSKTIFSARALQVPSVYSVHEWSFRSNQPMPIRLMNELTERFLIEKSDITLCLGKSLHRQAIKRFAVGKCKLANYGVNLRDYDYRKKATALTSEAGIQPGKTVVAYVEPLTSQMDTFTYLRAVEKVKKQTQDIQFLYFGNHEIKNDCIRMAQELDVADMLSFHSMDKNPADYLSIIDIYAVPFLSERAQPNILQAMAMEKAVVTTSADWVKEAIVDGVNGILCAGMSHEELAKGILRFHDNPKLRKSMGASARQTVESRYSLAMMMESYKEIFRSFPTRMSAAA